MMISISRIRRVAPELGLRPVVNGSRPAPAVPGTIVLASENVAGAYPCALGTAPPGYGKGISISPPRARPNSPASDAPPPSLPAPLAGVFTVATRSVHTLKQAVNEAAAARSMQLGWKWKLLVLRAQGAVLSAFFDAFVRFFEGLSSSTTGATGAIAGATGAVAGAPSVAAALEVGGEAAEGGGGEFGGQAAEGGVGEAIGHSAVSGAESLIRSRSPATVVDKGEAAAELPAAARPSSPSDFE
ncbi:hypothetical protein Ctob_005834 [Chrysochromulina tobinii]|uniref:Uncharacterized protein n=1 Tax=Chrysochromulina tobinii TaxID=1460289 RepID=A0A0M0JJQ5_9EUKA|nr:hypothetical protein Ctob_005834 [Chrysochromulina tobinii]|eukprot:KOO26552.1 hypothetical protein Ctob_005834 [Chrysochromulina sp. CCMP291]